MEDSAKKKENLNLRNFKDHLQQNVRVHLPPEHTLLTHKWMMNAAVIRHSSFIAAATDTKVPESNKSNGVCNLQRGGLVSLFNSGGESQRRGAR